MSGVEVAEPVRLTCSEGVPVFGSMAAALESCLVVTPLKPLQLVWVWQAGIFSRERGLWRP